MQRAALYTSGLVFALVALAHFVRFATNLEIVVGGQPVPVWLSLPATLVTAALAVWMVAAALRRG